jgi:pyruvate dehydrogenase E1 component alpha subunit
LALGLGCRRQPHWFVVICPETVDARRGRCRGQAETGPLTLPIEDTRDGRLRAHLPRPRRIRRAEGRAGLSGDEDQEPGASSIGQAVSVVDVLRPDDVADLPRTSTYMAKGGPLRELFAEMYGKATGVAGGKGGSMHLIDMSHNIIGTSAVVGTTIPLAVGYALTFKRLRADRVVASFFGDGATEEGVFTESLNFASLHRLPVLFVRENNYYASHTPITKRWANPRLCERVETYGIATHQIGASERAWSYLQQATELAGMRRGDGPVSSNAGPIAGANTSGRTKISEVRLSRTHRSRAVAGGRQSGQHGRAAAVERRGMIDAEIEREIADAIQFAEDSPFPESKALYTNVYAGN